MFRSSWIRVVLGIIVALFVWAAIGFIVFGFTQLYQNRNKYREYRSFAHLTDTDYGEKGILNKNDYFGDSYPADKKLILTGSHTVERLSIDCGGAKNKYELVIMGELTVTEWFAASDLTLIVEGTLAVGRLECAVLTNYGKLIDGEMAAFNSVTCDKITNYGAINVDNMYCDAVINYGRIDANVARSQSGGTIKEVAFHNTGHAKIALSHIDKINCQGGELEIVNQAAECEVTVNTLAEFLAGNTRFVKFGKETPSKNLTIIDNGINVNTQIYFSEQQDMRNTVFYLLLPLCILAATLMMGALSAIVVNARQKSRIQAKTANFTGNVFAYIGFSLLFGVVNGVTLCMIKPYLDSVYFRWLCKHTVLGGNNFRFTAIADSIFFRHMAWMLLSILTLGIYAFWRASKYGRWIAANIHVKNGLERKSTYSGTAKGFFRLVLHGLLRFLGVAAGLVFFVIILVVFINSDKLVWLILLPILLVLLYAAYFFANVWAVKCYYNDYIDLTWNQTEIDGKPLFTSKIKMKQFLIMILLSLITLGGYTLVLEYQIYSIILKNTII